MPQKKIVVEIQHQFAGDYPEDIPFANGVDIDALTKPDVDEGRKPYFVTLPLGEVGQVSHNNRRYVEDVAIKAIEYAISKNKIGGNLGHTPAFERGTHFAIPVLHWVGAMIREGVVWGKAYVPGDSERMREVRNYLSRQKATRSRVGTSLEGEGIQQWNEELETWDILELEVERIDMVGADGVGIDIAGSMSPHITKESRDNMTEAVAPGELAVGDLVEWESHGNLMRGKVNTIWDSGEVDIPYSDAPPLVATAENPIARMDVYEPSYDDGEWQATSYQVVRQFEQITKIDALPTVEARQREMLDADDGEVGDFVRWDSSGGTAQGQIDRIERNGTIDVPDSSFSVEGTEDDPAALISIYQESGDGWVKTDTQVGHKFSTLTLIDPLPAPTEDEEANGDNDMGEQNQTQDPLAELQAEHQERVTELTSQLRDANRELEPMRADLRSLRESLNVEESADIVLAVRNLLSERDSLAGENKALLESTIEAQIAEQASIVAEGLKSKDTATAAFAGTVRRTIAAQLESQDITRHAQVESAVSSVLGSEDVKTLLEALKRQVMGPNVNVGNNSNNNADEPEAYTF